MSRNNYLENARRTGAVLTAAGAAFLGGVGLKSAEAMPDSNTANAPELTNNLPPQIGVPKYVHVLANPSDMNAEAGSALLGLKQRLNEVIIIHSPTVNKRAIVGFGHSPSSFDEVNPQLGYDGADHAGAIKVTAAGKERFKGHDYLVILDDKSSKFGFLPLKWAIDSGAVSAYGYEGEETGPMTYNPYEDKPPTVEIYDKVPTAKTIGVGTDLHGKTRPLKPLTIKKAFGNVK
jgi:hypothetical protein